MLPLDPNKIVSLTRSMIEAGFTYHLGAKIVPLSAQALDVAEEHRQVDCSGFVRWCLFHALGQPSDFVMPDGSVQEHYDWAQQNFNEVPNSEGHLTDGAVRIAFLDPRSTSEGIGHVMLLVNGSTCESHGGKGPDMRPWGSQSWMADCTLYQLSAAP